MCCRTLLSSDGNNDKLRRIVVMSLVKKFIKRFNQSKVHILLKDLRFLPCSPLPDKSSRSRGFIIFPKSYEKESFK